MASATDRNAYVECDCVKNARSLAMLRETINVELVARTLTTIGDSRSTVKTWELHWPDCVQVVNGE